MATLGAFVAVLKVIAAALSIMLSCWRLIRMWKRRRNKRKPTA